MFDDAAAWWYPQINLTEVGHDPLRVRAVEASANLFRVLGVQPAMGAGFPVDELFARDPIAVISHRLWRDRFGSEPSVVGSSIVLSGVAHVVIGVMPSGFAFPSDTDVWQRLTWDMAQHSRGAHFMESVARLKPGTSIDVANAELTALSGRLGSEFSATKLSVAGILAGVAGALALGRTLSTFLNGVSPTDPLAFLTAISIALLVAVAACVLPARRAVATNVSVGLRSD